MKLGPEPFISPVEKSSRKTDTKEASHTPLLPLQVREELGEEFFHKGKQLTS